MRWKQTNLYNLKMMILMISTCLPTRASSYDLCPPRTLQAAKKIFWNNWQKFLFMSSTFSSFFPHLLVFKRVWVGVRPKLRSKRHHPLLTYRTENIKISKVCHKIVHVPLLCVDLAIIANFYDFFLSMLWMRYSDDNPYLWEDMMGFKRLEVPDLNIRKPHRLKSFCNSDCCLVSWELWNGLTFSMARLRAVNSGLACLSLLPFLGTSSTISLTVEVLASKVFLSPRGFWFAFEWNWMITLVQYVFYHIGFQFGIW